ncbi:MAG: alcohol dehydrogenase catalytic domain-containing protein [bacterium]|nr:alcohol dehydrogenase catalytic domain-containing protein [bacterium]
MRELTFVEPGRVEWTDAPEARLEGPDDALVRAVAVTTCDLDHAFVQGTVPIPGPFPLGHEFVADVVAVGDAVRNVRPGQRVVVPFQISCGRCDRCTRGQTGACRAVPHRSAYGLGPIGGTQWGGAFADLLRVPFADAMLLPLPDGVAPEIVACASDNLCDGWRAVAPYLRGDAAGAEVLVLGGEARSIGLYAVAAARALGASRVVYQDADADRRSVAAALGAEVVAERAHRLGRFAVTVDASNDAEGLACAIRSTDAWGTCTCVGVFFADVALPMLEMYGKGIHFVTGRANARADMPDVLRHVADGSLDPRPVMTGVHPWESAPEVLLAGPMKPVFLRGA